jgi:uncharacterized membrane protein YfcA
MTLKQRAILQTAGIIAVIVGGSVGISLILQNLTAEQITTGFAVLSIAALIYSMYGVVLSRLEYAETVKKLVDIQSK